MSTDRRVSHDRVVIDDVLFQREKGSHQRLCAICDLIIRASEDRYVPRRRSERKALVDGRHTRLCLTCVAGRLGEAGVFPVPAVWLDSRTGEVVATKGDVEVSDG